MRKHSGVLVLFTSLLGWSLLAGAAPQDSAATETARLNEWFAARWQEQLDFSPIQKDGHGPEASIPQILIGFHKVDDAGDMEAYITRIGGVSRAIGQLIARAKLSASEGVRPPRFAYEGVLAQARALVTGAPFTDQGTHPSGWTRRLRSTRS